MTSRPSVGSVSGRMTKQPFWGTRLVSIDDFQKKNFLARHLWGGALGFETPKWLFLAFFRHFALFLPTEASLLAKKTQKIRSAGVICYFAFLFCFVFRYDMNGDYRNHISSASDAF